MIHARLAAEPVPPPHAEAEKRRRAVRLLQGRLMESDEIAKMVGLPDDQVRARVSRRLGTAYRLAWPAGGSTGCARRSSGGSERDRPAAHRRRTPIRLAALSAFVGDRDLFDGTVFAKPRTVNPGRADGWAFRISSITPLSCANEPGYPDDRRPPGPRYGALPWPLPHRLRCPCDSARTASVPSMKSLDAGASAGPRRHAARSPRRPNANDGGQGSRTRRVA